MKKAQNGINKNLLILHFTVFIWGFTGILGQLISIAAVPLVWYRVLIAAASLWLYFVVNRIPFRMSRNSLLKLIGTGGIVGAHWILFFLSIKISTVSVTLVCLSSVTLFTAIIEPLVNRRRIAVAEILAGTLIISGISMIFAFESRYTLGIITGLASALAASLFSIINSRLIRSRPAPVIAFWEMLGAGLWITVWMAVANGFGAQLILQRSDLFYLLVLGTICTAAAYVAGVSVMREISPFRVALITNLEPVYGILLAFALFGDQEKMTAGFWFGSILILGTIFIFPYARRKLTKG
ncbi:MAG: EamA family transporter [Mucilaginibacter polytrichastri]|nr:EamA family transporter [Mucilaginibacter polytrichastri]